MKPYNTRNLTNEECIFNYMLSRARRVVENAFGIVANRFQILLKCTTMQHHHENVRIIVEACCILHNLMHTRYPVLQNKLMDGAQSDGNPQPEAWKEGRNLEDTISFASYLPVRVYYSYSFTDFVTTTESNFIHFPNPYSATYLGVCSSSFSAPLKKVITDLR
jgi:hypothetical protein